MMATQRNTFERKCSSGRTGVGPAGRGSPMFRNRENGKTPIPNDMW